MKYRYILIFIVGFILAYIFRLKNQFRIFYSKQGEIKIVAPLLNEPYHNGSIQTMEFGSIKVRTYSFPRYELGQVLKIEGKLPELESKKEGLFSSLPSQLTKFFDDKFLLTYPVISVVQNEELNFLFRFLSGLGRFKARWLESIHRSLPENQEALVAGVTLGHKSSLSPEFYQALQRTGVLHVVVASGQNVAILGQVLLSGLLLLMSRRRAVIWVLIAVGVYVLLAGMTAPIVRAGIMGGVSLLAMAWGRQKDGLVALGLAVMAMLLVSPMLLFDISWQLSVAATLGILVIYPRWWRWINDKGPVWIRGIGGELGVTLAAQLAVLPLVLLRFGNVSLVGPVVNLMVAPLVPVIMVGGGVVAITGLVSGILARIVAVGVWVPATIFVELVEGAARLSVASLELKNVPWWWAVGYYLLLVAMLTRREN